MLDHTFRVLRPGGRLVIVDREPRAASGESNESTAHNHEVPALSVESELRRRGFEILTREGILHRPVAGRCLVADCRAKTGEFVKGWI